jgi:hypothetical protein
MSWPYTFSSSSPVTPDSLQRRPGALNRIAAAVSLHLLFLCHRLHFRHENVDKPRLASLTDSSLLCWLHRFLDRSITFRPIHFGSVRRTHSDFQLTPHHSFHIARLETSYIPSAPTTLSHTSDSLKHSSSARLSWDTYSQPRNAIQTLCSVRNSSLTCFLTSLGQKSCTSRS